MILCKKAGRGVKRHLGPVYLCLMFYLNQAWISLLRLPESKAKRKVLKVRCFKDASSRGDASATLRSVFMQTIHEMSKIFILAEIDGRVSQFVCYGWLVAINNTWLQLAVLEQKQQEVGYWIHRCWSEVQAITVAPFCENGPLCFIDWSGWSYGPRFSQGRLSASTAQVREFGTGDTNWGSLLLNLIAKRSIWGWYYLVHINWKTSRRKDHSGWSDLVWIACLLPQSAGVECVRPWGSPDSWSTRTGFAIIGNIGPDLIPPSLFMQTTTVVLSVDMSKILFEQRSWKSLGSERLLLVPSSLYATCFLVGAKSLLLWNLLSEHCNLLLRHLWLKILRAWLSSIGWPWWAFASWSQHLKCGWRDQDHLF